MTELAEHMRAAGLPVDATCHPDCGPIVIVDDAEHAHENVDGKCWHDNEDR